MLLRKILPALAVALTLVVGAASPAAAQESIKITGELATQRVRFFPEMKIEYAVQVDKSFYLVTIKSDPKAKGFSSSVALDTGVLELKSGSKTVQRLTLSAAPATFQAYFAVASNYSTPMLIECIKPSKTANTCTLKQFRMAE